MEYGLHDVNTGTVTGVLIAITGTIPNLLAGDMSRHLIRGSSSHIITVPTTAVRTRLFSQIFLIHEVLLAPVGILTNLTFIRSTELSKPLHRSAIPTSSMT
ncbi:hypothetical protein AVEN_131323-1 [Araneus ventricosus]|uniref:Uncharacterized protein n=1 Tax=Araneus ventricosus TaxID=182803 RepID=A0A4Y2I0V9_ARAVE|nr:hypothetical protein AVEN_131323-1 [Araneus ventricosus]